MPLAYYCAFIGVIFPFLSLYYKQIGLNMGQIGLLTALPGLTIIIAQQMWGYYADEVFGAKKLLIMTNTIAVAFFFIIGMTKTFYILVIFVFIFYFFNSPMLQLLNSLLLKQKDGARKYSFIRSFGSFAFVITNVLMGYITTKTKSVWIIFPAAIIIIFLFNRSLRKVPDIPKKKSRPEKFIDIQKYFLRNKKVIYLLMMIFFAQSAYSASYMFLSFYIKELKGTNSDVAWCYSLAALIEIPFFMIMGRLSHKYGNLFLIKIALLLQIIRWFGVYCSSSIFHIYLTQLLHPITFSFFYVGTIVYINKIAGEKHHSSAQTLHGLIYSGLSQFLGNLLGGQIVQIFGLQILFLLSSLSNFIAYLIFLKLSKGEKHYETQGTHH